MTFKSKFANLAATPVNNSKAPEQAFPGLILGDKTDSPFKPRLLPEDSLQHHPDAQRFEGPVVYWASGAVVHAGAVAGEHDGIRDGWNSPGVDFSGVRIYYARAVDFLRAGGTL